MPEFSPEHAESARMQRFRLDDFTVGYLEAAEWLACKYENGRDDPALTQAERGRCHGWTEKAVWEAKRDCRAFQRAYSADLCTYLDHGYNLRQAGTDYYLSRNGHGSGFFDRGWHPVFKILQRSARADGEAVANLYRNRLTWL